MTVRPELEEETVERLNEMVDDAMHGDPEEVSVDTKLTMLLDLRSI